MDFYIVAGSLVVFLTFLYVNIIKLIIEIIRMSTTWKEEEDHIIMGSCETCEYRKSCQEEIDKINDRENKIKIKKMLARNGKIPWSEVPEEPVIQVVDNFDDTTI